MNSQAQHREQTAQFIWTGFIIMFFAIQAVIWMVAIVMTSNDSSHAIVHDFDPTISSQELQSRQDSSKALGWKAVLTVSQPAAGSDTSEIELRLTDRENQPIDVPSIRLDAFHCAQAAVVQSVELTATEPGIYHGNHSFRKNGNWQFNSMVVRDEDRFYFSERQYLSVSNTSAK